jgi:lambda family phage portal protein
MRVFDFFTKGRSIRVPADASPDQQSAPAIPVINLRDLNRSAPIRSAWHDGEKFPGGFGVTKLLTTDYWTLRARSAQLFRTNHYARGIIRRLVLNEINTGLHLEATPSEELLGYKPDELDAWSETTETRFELWGKTPKLCDYCEQLTFGALQAQARLEALVSGDVLVVLIQDPRTKLPRVRLVDASCVQSPMDNTGKGEGNKIKHGVELDSSGRHVAYWVQKEDYLNARGSFERIPAVGPVTGRRMAWLLYGTDKRLDDVRGEPLLSLCLQSLQEIDRYRDALQLKASLLARFVAWVEKTEDKVSSKAFGGGAVRKGTDTAVDTTETERSFQVAEYIPGVLMEELQHGEKVHAFQSQGTTESFADFESTIIAGISWGNGIPPEILTLQFANNYSASKAAINEFKLSLNVWRQTFGEQFCQFVYEDWLLSQVLAQRIDAPKMLEAWRDPDRYEELAAWCCADWTGQIKPEIDFGKAASGCATAIEEGLMTRDRASRELTGTKFSRNVRELLRENEQLAKANEAIVKLNKPEPPAAPEKAPIKAPAGKDDGAEDAEEADDVSGIEPEPPAVN